MDKTSTLNNKNKERVLRLQNVLRLNMAKAILVAENNTVRNSKGEAMLIE